MDARLGRLLVGQVAFLGVAVGLMFLLAGRLDWLGGWLVAALFAGSLAAQWLLVGRRHPDLLIERSGIGEGADRGDIPFAMVMARGPLIAMLVAGLEVRLAGLPEIDPIVLVSGLVIAVVGIAITLAAMLANRFFAPVVRIQSDRGHAVVADGPYHVVRHPGYVGVLLFYLGLPLVLGSWWSVPVMAVSVAVALVRTAREDRYLTANLPGYREYTERVRWRLVPRVW